MADDPHCIASAPRGDCHSRETQDLLGTPVVTSADDRLRHRVTALSSEVKPHRLAGNHRGAIRRVDPRGKHYLLRSVVWLSSLLVIPLGLLVGATAYVQLNISPSLPLGLYRLHPVARPLTRGMLVIVHVPGWSARTVPFLKPVA